MRTIRQGILVVVGFAVLLGIFFTIYALVRNRPQDLPWTRLDLDQLTSFARWRPNMRETRNFDTRFYVAVAPDAAVAEADGGESVRSLWISAASALADADSGHHRIIFPTRRNLERLALFASFADAAADARAHPVRTITPWIEARDDGRHLCIPDDLGYPVTSEPLAQAIRA